MKTIKNLLIRLRLRRISQQDVVNGIQQKDLELLGLIIQFGAYRERVSAVLGLGQLRVKNAIPVLSRLLWDDFETVALAAQNSLQAYLPNTNIEQQLQSAKAYWAQKKEQRSLKRKVIWYNTNNPLKPPSPLIDKSKMQMLAKIKVLLQKPIR